MLKIGPVKIPVFKVIAAIPEAVQAAAAVAKDDKSPGSPGGEKVTAGEVAEAIAAFLGALGEAIAPAVAKANGLDL